MKTLRSAYSGQCGFTLLESLIGLALFSIIFLGTSAALKHLTQAQTQINSSLVITNILQARLQNALDHVGAGNICSSVNQDTFSLGKQTYYTFCSIEEHSLANTSAKIKWPFLVASTSQNEAQECATGVVHETCYVVGR